MTFFQLGAKHGNFTTEETIHKQQELFANEAELELSEEELNAVAGGAGGLTPTCSDGSGAVAACFSGRSGTCGLGYRCDTALGLCCLQKAIPVPVCPKVGSMPMGNCINGICRSGYTCTANNLCC